jgi:hypothetical protein
VVEATVVAASAVAGSAPAVVAILVAVVPRGAGDP